nr:ATP synthase F1 subunit epsilon [uncultured Lachnoanaerobaculum sp.]
MDKFALKIMCPDHVFFEGDATMVEYTTTQGNVGIYAKHIPMVNVIAPGKLIIHCEDGSVKNCALHSGFSEILQDKVTILADSCEYGDEIDVVRAKEAKERAEKRLSQRDGIDVARAELALRRALVRLDVAGNK